jgi:hypothetical protein
MSDVQEKIKSVKKQIEDLKEKIKKKRDEFNDTTCTLALDVRRVYSAWAQQTAAIDCWHHRCAPTPSARLPNFFGLALSRDLLSEPSTRTKAIF